MEVQSLVPGPLQQLPDADSFMAALPQHDGEMAALAAEAEAQGGVLRYVGVVDVQGCSCGVKVARSVGGPQLSLHDSMCAPVGRAIASAAWHWLCCADICACS
jgi:hypothetical protein